MIPVNLITGFLGTGKTTLIRQLLAQHPADERWAVLVNEFGEIGVDGRLLDDQGIAIEEVAGGCLCCVAAPAFAVGLNRLIRSQRPDRILIEPSGLGHPAQILQQLRSPLYQSVLQLQATLCVMDARHLDSLRHREHPTFVDQIHLADILIANKADTYTAANEQSFLDFAATLQPRKSRLIITQQGRVDSSILKLAGQTREAAFPEAHAFLLQQQAPHTPEHAAWTVAERADEGYCSLSWWIHSQYQCEQQALCAWLDTLPVERIKGVLHAESGWFSYNRSTDSASIAPASADAASRLQIIHSQPLAVEAYDQPLRELLNASA